MNGRPRQWHAGPLLTISNIYNAQDGWENRPPRDCHGPKAHSEDWFEDRKSKAPTVRSSHGRGPCDKYPRAHDLVCCSRHVEAQGRRVSAGGAPTAVNFGEWLRLGHSIPCWRSRGSFSERYHSIFIWVYRFDSWRARAIQMKWWQAWTLGKSHFHRRFYNLQRGMSCQQVFVFDHNEKWKKGFFAGALRLAAPMIAPGRVCGDWFGTQVCRYTCRLCSWHVRLPRPYTAPFPDQILSNSVHFEWERILTGQFPDAPWQTWPDAAAPFPSCKVKYIPRFSVA